ncbi:hypothetical protein, partial [Sansalvadorimonas verongulae]|uniref:hypothetical protein n=1 Tax=Sansalvadorimonas verongulae TaxID=2172824 RepID=UPI001E55EFC5
WADLRKKIFLACQGLALSRIVDLPGIKKEPWLLRELFWRMTSRGYQDAENLINTLHQGELTRAEWRTIDATVRVRVSEPECVRWWGSRDD